MKGTADRTGQDGLADRLRAATAAGPAGAYLDALRDGRQPRAAYAALLAQRFFLYEALEQAAVAMRDDPVAGLFVFPELTRLPDLLSDLDTVLGADWAERLDAVPATVTYCRRLQEVAFTWPAGFVAHHYTRYLNDLSVGVGLGDAVRRAYGLQRNGYRLFGFDGVQPESFRTRYCELLDAVPWDTTEQDRFLAEATLAHRLDAAILRDLNDRYPA